MTITFHGAARSVTRSRPLVETPAGRVLLDCGLFQGRRQEGDRQNRYLGFDPQSVQAVLLSHAHIDHSGALPILGKHGFRGNVHMTGATADLTAVMLEDSARVQENDCAYVNKKEGRWGDASLRPFYDTDDTKAIIRRFVGTDYGRTIRVAPQLSASFHDTGHILGSAAVRLTYRAQGNTTTILFSGDLDRARMPVLRDPASPPSCDVLIMESTYGDRLHEEVGEALKAKAEQMVAHARAHRSKIIVPAFAVGRTQDIIMRIKELVMEGRIDPLPIYIDSPLAARATEVFRKHPECYDEETYRTFVSQEDLFGARYIRYVSSVEESKQLNTMKGPCIIVASSGMCEGGRVLHHLKHAVQDEANLIAIVGFQAEHTLGRKLVERPGVVPIFGIPTPRRAQVILFNGLSAHADRNGLLAYVRSISPAPAWSSWCTAKTNKSLSLAHAIRAELPKAEVSVPSSGQRTNCNKLWKNPVSFPCKRKSVTSSTMGRIVPFRQIALVALILILFAPFGSWATDTGSAGPADSPRQRARDLGIVVGRYQPGPLNAITDLPGVKVGHVTLVEGEGALVPGQGPIRTGVTVLIPREDVWRKKVPAGAFVLNGTGEMTGLAWMTESGFLEYPIALTNTLNVPRVSNGVMSWMIKQYPGIGITDDTLTPVVAECDDSRLNDSQGRHVSELDVMTALDTAATGPVPEGSVGAGTGMVSYGFKGGIGTSSRRLPDEEGGYTIGVLVNANHGRRPDLTVAGVPVGRLYDKEPSPAGVSSVYPNEQWTTTGPGSAEGSIIIIIGTDAPLDARQLTRLAKRAALGLARTGSTARHGSGDFMLAFSTGNVIPHYPKDPIFNLSHLSDAHINPILAATVEATEEAILNALTGATTVVGRDGHRAEAISLPRLRSILRDYSSETH